MTTIIRGKPSACWLARMFLQMEEVNVLSEYRRKSFAWGDPVLTFLLAHGGEAVVSWVEVGLQGLRKD